MFAASFFGAPLLLLRYGTGGPAATGAAAGAAKAAATAVFWVGSLGVTVTVNIPLNEQLAAVPVQSAPAARVAEARRQFAPAWNRWHNVRTSASILALALR
ncbi:MAG: anthrone oxygenase family protein [Hymenobacter sp.]